MDSWTEIKKTWSSRKTAPKFAAAMIMIVVVMFNTLKDGLVRLYQTIFVRLNAFLPFPGAARPPSTPSAT